MADVESRTEDWRTLPWKDIQRNVFRLQKRIYRAARQGLPFTTEDVMEVHHHDGNHSNNYFDNLRLLHGHCHDVVHGSRCQ